MEQKFVSEIPVTLELYKEWANSPVGRHAVNNRKKRIALCVTGCVCGSVIIVLGMLTREFYEVLMGASFFAIFVSWLFFVPNRALKKRYDMITKSYYNSGRFSIKTTFADNIVIEDGRSTTRYEYKDLLKVTEKENYFFLFLNEDMVIRIRKDSFVLGSSDDFREFINSAVHK